MAKEDKKKCKYINAVEARLEALETPTNPLRDKLDRLRRIELAGSYLRTAVMLLESACEDSKAEHTCSAHVVYFLEKITNPKYTTDISLNTLKALIYHGDGK